MKTPQSGVTLFELMVGISIMGILVSLAVPTFQDFGRNARVVAAQNDIVTALNYSRSEAIRRSTVVTVCATASFTDCGDTGDWPAGWFSFNDANANGARENDEEILQLWRGPGETDVSVMTAGAGADHVSFTATGLVTPTAVTKTLMVYASNCPSGEQRARRVQVNGIGSIRNDRMNCP